MGSTDLIYKGEELVHGTIFYDELGVHDTNGSNTGARLCRSIGSTKAYPDEYDVVDAGAQWVQVREMAAAAPRAPRIGAQMGQLVSGVVADI